MKRKLSVIFIILLIGVLAVNYSFAATTSELQAQKANAQKQKEQATNELNEIKEEKQATVNEVSTLNSQIDSVEDEIDKLKAQLSQLNTSITAKETEITAKEDEIKEKEELLKKRLIAMYKNGGTSYLDILLGATGPLEMLVTYDAVKEIADADTNLINEVTSQKESLEEDKKELVSQKSEVDSLKAQQEAKNVELAEKKNQKTAKVAELTEDEKAKQKEVEEFDAAIKNADAQIREQAAKAQEQINKAGLKFDGTFIWPCNNKTITSRMKYRWGRQHKGIDIAASYENVYASASGYAYNATNPGGYGTYIMIYHGGNYVTLYGHLSSSHVSNGQYVKQGQVIATSGNSGGSKGPHLHFEIRQASSMSGFFATSPLNPTDYLPGGYTLATGA